MSWEVSNLIINDDTGITIAYSSNTLSNVKPSDIYTQYESDAQNYGSMNRNANTILCGKGNSSRGYDDVFGLTLPTDKTIYIQTDQNDGNVWFWWDGLSSSNDFGSNAFYYRGFNISQYYTYGFNFSNSAVNCWGGISTKTINSKVYYAQTWLGSSEQFLPLIWTTIPLTNFVINGETYDSNKSGGAGSGYIGNSLLSNKKMVGFNVPTSSAEATKTESVNEASETPVSGKPKIGNGFARIKFLRNADPQPEPGYDDIINKFQNYIIWGSWSFKDHDVLGYQGSPTYDCTFPMCIINSGGGLQSSSWTTNGSSYFCGKARCEITGQDGVGYNIVISGMTDTKPIRSGSTEYNYTSQIIYNNGHVATSLYYPSIASIPERVTASVSYSGVTLRDALTKMISMVVGNCDLIVNGTPWILV